MAAKGSVILVGAGPGDPELLTLAGRTALAEAEVVLYDRLIGPEVMRFISPAAELLPVGKNKGDHSVPQEEINCLLLEKARAGKRVVRLKGGDPYLFGRGAEELELLAENGIPFRVIPGVTSAIAAPAYAGIPVTHRRYASSVHILTGHGKAGSPPPIPYPALAAMGGTLIFLMGLSAVEEICAGLLREGMAADTPAAAIEKGTRPDQRRVVATLATLPQAVRREKVVSPAMLVVGEVCALAEQYDWTTRLPLWGKRIACVSAETTASRLAELLRRQGADVLEFAAIARTPLPQAPDLWEKATSYEWVILTSPFGAELFFQGLRGAEVDLRRFHQTRFAAVGSRTGQVLRDNGIVPDFVPPRFNGGELAQGLSQKLAPGDRIMLFRARDGDPELARRLRGCGAHVDDVPAYTTEPTHDADSRKLREALSARRLDALTFTSASSVNSFADANPDAGWTDVPAFCIGDVTAAALRNRHCDPIVSVEATLESVADSLAAFFSSSRPETS